MNTPKVNKLTFGVFIFTFSIALFLVNGIEIFKNTSKQGDCEINKVVKTVRGESMRPLLKHGQAVVVNEGYYSCNEPNVGDVVVVDHANREVPLIKIIKAKAGDSLSVVEENGRYYIEVDHIKVVNSVGAYYTLSQKEVNILKLYERDYGGVIPKDAYLILGDNINSSIDSTEFGLVSRESLLGGVEYVE